MGADGGYLLGYVCGGGAAAYEEGALGWVSGVDGDGRV